MSGRVLIVCTGNLCRSPYLHRRLQLALPEHLVESAGTGALVDRPMDPRMAAHLGVDADLDFRARPLTAALVLDAGLVLAATREHRTAVTRLVPKALRYTFAAADFAQLADSVPDVALLAGRPLAERVALVAARRPLLTPLPADQADIPDPFRRSAQDYAAAAGHIDELVPAIARALS